MQLWKITILNKAKEKHNWLRGGHWWFAFFLLTIHSVNYRLVYETVRCASHCGAIALINERRYANLLEEEKLLD